MTNEVQKIREGIEKLKSQLIRGACASQLAIETRCKEEAYNEVLAMLDLLQEEPVSEKKCLFTKDNYTDEDRKVLCEDCDEDCEYAKKVEPVSVDLGEYINELSKKFPEVSFAKLSRIAVRVAKWKEKQMMAEATEAVVAIDSGGYPYIDKTIELYDYDRDAPLAKEGEKYKVILIKDN